ncbi:hypothetical protein BDY19DRAFT_929555 [Irpex rosettiformis]|uniref:Uncharacterized protein n=1 Tax=Irpex rosettiformis TaxID=378272 RepID=A0ACB8UDF5_9APHY|nr:hypothetical protein BDY19DRAFT_929555 [Irpex rosettiformis]
MDDTSKLEVWFQYKGDLASEIQATKNTYERTARTPSLIARFNSHLRSFALNVRKRREDKIVWGTGQIRASWVLEKDSGSYNYMHALFDLIPKTAIHQCPTKDISSITLRETDMPQRVIFVKGYNVLEALLTSAELTHTALEAARKPAMPSSIGSAAEAAAPAQSEEAAAIKNPLPAVGLSKDTSRLPTSMGAATSFSEQLPKVAQRSVSQIDMIQPTKDTTPSTAVSKKRKKEDEPPSSSSTPQPKRLKPSLAVPSLITQDSSRQTLSVSLDIPRFIVPPPPLTPFDNLPAPHNDTATHSEIPYEGYILPSISFQQYRVYTSDSQTTLVKSIQRHLGKTRTRLVEAMKELVAVRDELIEEKKERARLEKELEYGPERKREEVQPVFLPPSPPRSPRSTEPMSFEEANTDEEDLSSVVTQERSRRDALEKEKETMSAQITGLQEALLKEYTARKTAEQEVDNERRKRMQAERTSDPFKGIASATAPAFLEALNKLAQLTDKVMLAHGP